MKLAAKAEVVGLNFQDALRIETEWTLTQKIKKNGEPTKQKQWNYIFLCKFCNKEIKVRKYEVKYSMGSCKKCADLEKLKKAVPLAKKINTKQDYLALFNSFKQHAKKEGKSFSLTFDEFLKFTKINNCGYCNLEIKWAKNALWRTGYKYNLDRKDNNIGYTEENCFPCCKDCNYIKGNRFTFDEFMLLSPILTNIQNNRKNS